MTNPKRENRLPFDPDCLMFFLPIGVIGALGWAGWMPWLWMPALLLIIAILLFFRDPPRLGPKLPGALWSPADGKVVAIEPNDSAHKGPLPGQKIVIFLSVLNCHVNRSPCAAKVEKIRYQRGKFLNALDPRSSELNESNWIFLRSGAHSLTVRQITGLIARRIVCRAREGQELGRGERIGLIRFGSRTELYLPEQAEIKVRVGDAVRGGKTLMAILPQDDKSES